jgi:hypothetical protein
VLVPPTTPSGTRTPFRYVSYRISACESVAKRKPFETVLAMAADQEEVSLERLNELASASASAPDREQFGEIWLQSLLDLLERGGVGRLERRSDGRVAFVFASELPSSAEEAWRSAAMESE